MCSSSKNGDKFYFDKLFGKDYKPTPPQKKILDLTRGSEGIRKGQALKKQPRYTEKLGLNELCVLWWTNSKCNKLHVCYVQQSVSGYSWQEAPVDKKSQAVSIFEEKLQLLGFAHAGQSFVNTDIWTRWRLCNFKPPHSGKTLLNSSGSEALILNMWPCQ